MQKRAQFENARLQVGRLLTQADGQGVRGLRMPGPEPFRKEQYPFFAQCASPGLNEGSLTLTILMPARVCNSPEYNEPRCKLKMLLEYQPGRREPDEKKEKYGATIRPFVSS